MKTVVDNNGGGHKVEDLFVRSLRRHFDVSCKANKQGTLVCDLVSKSLFRKPRGVIIRVPSELVDDHGYVQALIETGVRKLMSGAYD